MKELSTQRLRDIHLRLSRLRSVELTRVRSEERNDDYIDALDEAISALARDINRRESTEETPGSSCQGSDGDEKAAVVRE